jgi:hypothetical protein
MNCSAKTDVVVVQFLKLAMLAVNFGLFLLLSAGIWEKFVMKYSSTTTRSYCYTLFSKFSTLRTMDVGSGLPGGIFSYQNTNFGIFRKALERKNLIYM